MVFPNYISHFVIPLVIAAGCGTDAVTDKATNTQSIDLSHWKLTLPVDEDRDGKADEYVDLATYQSNSSIKPYLYDGPNGSLVFYCPYTGITTPNSRYPRTELREQLAPGDNNVNWTMEKGGAMVGRLKVADISKGHRTIVMQIHGRLTKEQKEKINAPDNDAPPLLKIFFQNNKIRVVRKILVNEEIEGEAILSKEAWKDDSDHYFEQELGNKEFTLMVLASRGRLEVRLNDVAKVYEDLSMQRWPFDNYFKAGNYLQSTDNNAFAKVEFYSLKVTH